MFTVGIRLSVGGGSYGIGPVPAETGSLASSEHPAGPNNNNNPIQIR
jgi:hypothetical protein